MTAPAVFTNELPLSLPLKKPILLTNLAATVEIRPPHAQVRNLSLNVFGGQLIAEAEIRTGGASLPFSGKIAVQRLQLGSLMEAVGTDKRLDQRDRVGRYGNPRQRRHPARVG